MSVLQLKDDQYLKSLKIHNDEMRMRLDIDIAVNTLKKYVTLENKVNAYI
jgi:hypothetical protein